MELHVRSSPVSAPRRRVLSPRRRRSAPPNSAKIEPWIESRLHARRRRLVPRALRRRGDVARRRRAPRRGRVGPRGKITRPAAPFYDVLRHRARLSQAEVRDELTKAGIPFRTLYIVNGSGGARQSRARAPASRPAARSCASSAIRSSAASTSTFAPRPTAPTAVEWVSPRSRPTRCGPGQQARRRDRRWHPPTPESSGRTRRSRGKYRGWNGTTAEPQLQLVATRRARTLPRRPTPRATGRTLIGTMVGDGGAGIRSGSRPGRAGSPAATWMRVGNGTPSTYMPRQSVLPRPVPHETVIPELDGDPSIGPRHRQQLVDLPAVGGVRPGRATGASFAALRTAGILAVAAAGNSSTSCSIGRRAARRSTTNRSSSERPMLSNFLANFSSRGAGDDRRQQSPQTGRRARLASTFARPYPRPAMRISAARAWRAPTRRGRRLCSGRRSRRCAGTSGSHAASISQSARAIAAGQLRRPAGHRLVRPAEQPVRLRAHRRVRRHPPGTRRRHRRDRGRLRLRSRPTAARSTLRPRRRGLSFDADKVDPDVDLACARSGKRHALRRDRGRHRRSARDGRRLRGVVPGERLDGSLSRRTPSDPDP